MEDVMAKIKAFGYIRVSGKGQIKGDGLTRQETAIADYAQKHGIDIAHVFKDQGVSGTLSNRPALTHMLVALEQNGKRLSSNVLTVWPAI